MKRKNSTYNLSKDTYQSIEFMPIWNWNKIMETRDLKYLFLNNKDSENYIKDLRKLIELECQLEETSTEEDKEHLKETIKKLESFLVSVSNLWDDLQDEYIKVFGLDANFIKRLKLLKEKARLNYKIVETGDRFINTLLSIVDADLKELDSGVSMAFYELKSHLEKDKGIRIDPKITTVIEWHYDLKNMANG